MAGRRQEATPDPGLTRQGRTGRARAFARRLDWKWRDACAALDREPPRGTRAGGENAVVSACLGSSRSAANRLPADLRLSERPDRSEAAGRPGAREALDHPRGLASLNRRSKARRERSPVRSRKQTPERGGPRSVATVR